MTEQVEVRYVGPSARPITIAATDARVCRAGSPFAVVATDDDGTETRLPETAMVPRGVGERLAAQVDAWEPVGWDPTATVVPESVDDVKGWVGDDPERAQIAADVELHRTGGPRKTLLPWLNERAATNEQAADGGEEV